MKYTMFTKQYSMTAGLEALASWMCSCGRLKDADSTLLANRPKSQTAFSFIEKKLGVATEVLRRFLNVYKGVWMRGRIKSRSNPQNVIVDSYIIEIELLSEEVTLSSIQRSPVTNQERGQAW